ncbi:MAG: TonB-dependent receptor, partial [Rhodanobacter sp.]
RHASLYSDSFHGHAARNYDASTLTVRHDFGWATLQSISNATGYALSHVEDADGTNHVVSHLDTGVDGSGTSLYQEFKLAGGNQRLDWVAGASYASEHARQTNLIESNTDT